jgi:hypothetical protein
LNQEDTSHLPRSRTSNEIQAAIKGLPKMKTPGLTGITDEFHQTFKELITAHFNFSMR